MPGANCSIFNCNTSRKHKGISIFKIPSGDDDYNKKWRENLIGIMIKHREVDPALRKQIEAKSLHICGLHYADAALIRNEKKTTLVPGSLQTLNLPIKSFKEENRSTASIQKRDSASTNILQSTPPNSNLVVYKFFEETNCDTQTLTKVGNMF